MDERLSRLQNLLGSSVWEAPAPVQDVNRTDASYDHTNSDGYEEAPCGSPLSSDDMEPQVPLRIPREEPDVPDYALQTGEVSATGGRYVPLQALEKFTHTYVEAPDRNKVHRKYFEKHKFYGRRWDLFYIYAPRDISPNACLLLPLPQVEHFIWSINKRLSTNIGIPEMEQDSGFTFESADDGTPRPRYIGQSENSQTAALLKKAAPSDSYRPSNEPASKTPSDESLEAFREKMRDILESNKRKKLAAQQRREAERHAKQQGWNHVTKRVQRYLGLREVANGKADESWEKASDNTIAAQVDDLKSGLTKLSIKHQLNLSEPVPYQQESSVVFICVDIEAYEKNHNLVTEIGIATLDTADIANIAPGDEGRDWLSNIRARHFRIEEHAHLNNTEYVQGCADNFRFGESEWIWLKDAPHAIAECFKPPFSGSPRNSPTKGEGPEANDDEDEFAPANLKRNIVLVGHDLQADISYLRQLGYEPRNLSNLIECTDTAHMYRSLRRDINATSLGRCLADLGIAGWDLHNAANDAVYTLQIMVIIAVKALTDKQETRENENESTKKKIQETMQLAANQVLEEKNGWSSGGDDSDGGHPEPPFEGGNRSARRNRPSHRAAAAADKLRWW